MDLGKEFAALVAVIFL